jgi:hypothetical protein
VHRPLLDAGGLPVALPQLVDAVAPVLDAVDAIVLAPGRDIDPLRYGQEPHSLLAATEPQRDAFELALVVQALDRGMPTLGMCRGVQLLNVALGGTLVQDVSLVAAGHPSDPGWARWKEVEAASVAGEPMRRIRATSRDRSFEPVGGRTGSDDDRGQLVPPPGDRPARYRVVVGAVEFIGRFARGGRVARASRARRAMGAPGGVAGRRAVRARVFVVRRRGSGAAGRVARPGSAGAVGVAWERRRVAWSAESGRPRRA